MAQDRNKSDAIIETDKAQDNVSETGTASAKTTTRQSHILDFHHERFCQWRCGAREHRIIISKFIRALISTLVSKIRELDTSQLKNQ